MIETLQAKEDRRQGQVHASSAASETKDIAVTLEARPTTGPAAGGGGQGGGGGGGGGGRAAGAVAPRGRSALAWVLRPRHRGRRSRPHGHRRTARPPRPAFKADDLVLDVNGKKAETFRDLLETAARKEGRRQGQAHDPARRGKEDGRSDAGAVPPGRRLRRRWSRRRPRPAGRTAPRSAASAKTSRRSRAPTATRTAASTSPPTAARPGRASTASTRGRCTSARSASIRATTSTSTSSASASTRPTDGGKTFRGTGGERHVHADQHALWIDPKDGRHMLVGSDGGFYVTYDRMEHWDHLTLADSASSTTSPSTTASRTASTAACRTTAAGAGRAGRCAAAGRSTRTGSWSAAATASSAASIRTTPTSSTARARTARFAGATCGPARGHRCATAGGHTGRSGGGAAAAVRRPGRTPAPLQLEHAVHPVAPQPGHLLRRRRNRLPLAQARRRPEADLAGDHADQARHGDGAGRVAAQPGRALGRHRRRRPVGDARRRPGVEAGRRKGRPAGPALGGDHRGVALRRGPGLRLLRRPPLRRRRAVRLRHRGLRRDVEVARGQPAGLRLDALLREDVQNPNLLFCGTEFAVCASINRGGYWTKINNNLPTVAVHELAIHPTAGEIVAATHGRSLWVLDVSALRQMTPEVVKAAGAPVRPADRPSAGGRSRRSAAASATGRRSSSARTRRGARRSTTRSARRRTRSA